MARGQVLISGPAGETLSVFQQFSLITVCASVICNITFIANAILQRAQNGKYMTTALYEITYLTGLLLNRPGGGHGS